MPTTPRIPVTDVYFGMKVTDYYRWMENTDDSSMIKWLNDEDQYAENTFSKISGRQELVDEYNKIDSIKRDFLGGLRKDKDDYLFSKIDLKGNWYILEQNATGTHVLIDFASEFPGKKMSAGPFFYSPVSKYVALHVHENNHEGTTIFFF
jgi:prolyl oligopeptidase